MMNNDEVKIEISYDPELEDNDPSFLIENERFQHILDMELPKDLCDLQFKNEEEKQYFLASYYRWCPDLFLDVMTPENGRHLNLYQRVLLRVLFRFKYVYTTIPRGSAKSFIQVLAYMLMAVMYPTIKLSILAETKQQSASIVKDKYEEMLEWFPFFKEEILDKPQFQNDIAIIRFKNGSRIDNLANALVWACQLEIVDIIIR